MALTQQVISHKAVKKKKTVKIIKYFSHSNEMRLTDSCFLGHMSPCQSLHLGLKHPTRLKDFVSSGKTGRVATYSPTSQGCCEDLRSIPLLMFLSQGQRKRSHDLCLCDLPVSPSHPASLQQGSSVSRPRLTVKNPLDRQWPCRGQTLGHSNILCISSMYLSSLD